MPPGQVTAVAVVTLGVDPANRGIVTIRGFVPPTACNAERLMSTGVALVPVEVVISPLIPAGLVPPVSGSRGMSPIFVPSGTERITVAL